MLIEVCGRQCLPVDGIARAVQAASGADVAIVLVGDTEEQETETKDRTNLSLPGEQSILVEAVCAANPRTVVVVHAGMPVDLECAEGASALLYGWFAGQEVGPALADVLIGVREPGGRLPFTIAALEDYPATSTQPDADNRLHYTESVFVGYRHFDKEKIEPTFAFGHGLGYGEFTYGGFEVEGTSCEKEARARVVVRNVGACRSKEVVQLYLSELAPLLPCPLQELAAVAVVHLDPGESQEVVLVLPPRAFARWDVHEHSWVEQAGVFRGSVGRSSRDVRCSVEFERVEGGRAGDGDVEREQTFP